MARHILYLTNTRLVSLEARGSRVVARKEFDVDSGVTAEFERHLRSLRKAPTHIITDLAEEDFRLDTIPHVGARDRDAIIARKLNQVFRSTPFRHAVVQGREAEGRRDDHVLYTAITNPEVLQPWLEAIERLGVPLAGIHSAAAFSGRLLATLQLEFAHTLLVTFTPGAAIRQTYFRDKEVRFSRLTPIDLEDGQSLGQLLTEETTRTWQYLDSLRNFTDQDLLEVCVLAHPKDRPELEPHLRDFGQIRYRLLDIEQVADKIGLKPPPLTSSAEGILAHLFLRHRAPNEFAGVDLRKNAVIRNARIALNTLSALVLAGGLAWGGYALTKAIQAEAQDFLRSRELAAVKRETEEIRRALPTHGIGGAAMRETVAFYNGAVRQHPSIVEFVVPLTRVLEEQPRIRLLQFAWQAGADPRATPALTPTTLRDAAPVKAIRRAPEAAPATPGEAVEAPFAARRYPVALLEASVRVVGGDYRKALDDVDRLAKAVGALAGYKAEIVESPLDTRPAGAVLGRIVERESESIEARFTMRVERAPAGAP